MNHPFGIFSPVSVVSMGVLTFYIAPSIYWLIRPWPYDVASYTASLWMVQVGVIVQAIPFLLAWNSRSVQSQRQASLRLVFPQSQSRLWCLVVLIAAGVAWQFYLLSLGSQARLQRDDVLVFGSEELGFLFNSVSTYYPVSYLCLFVFGTPFQRRVAKAAWILDGLIVIFSLHRYDLLAFSLRSAVGLHLGNRRFRASHAIAVLAVLVVVVPIIGASATLVKESLETGQRALDPVEVLGVLVGTTQQYRTEAVRGPNSSSASSFAGRVVDDFLFRLYDARSEAAVMAGVPETVPYANGSTFQHILYSFIPRILWPDKPSIRSVHETTKTVMGTEGGGLSPVGTVGEFYLNFGYFGMVLCAIVTFGIVRMLQMCIPWRGVVTPLTVLTYPIAVELLMAANYHFSQRIVFAVHLLIFGFIVRLMVGPPKPQAGRGRSATPRAPIRLRPAAVPQG